MSGIGLASESEQEIPLLPPLLVTAFNGFQENIP